jgi:hypothetical protein
MEKEKVRDLNDKRVPLVRRRRGDHHVGRPSPSGAQIAPTYVGTRGTPGIPLEYPLRTPCSFVHCSKEEWVLHCALGLNFVCSP